MIRCTVHIWVGTVDWSWKVVDVPDGASVREALKQASWDPEWNGVPGFWANYTDYRRLTPLALSDPIPDHGEIRVKAYCPDYSQKQKQRGLHEVNLLNVADEFLARIYVAPGLPLKYVVHRVGLLPNYTQAFPWILEDSQTGMRIGPECPVYQDLSFRVLRGTPTPASDLPTCSFCHTETRGLVGTYGGRQICPTCSQQ